MLDVMAFILMALTVVAGDDGKRSEFAIDILGPGRGLIGTLAVKRTATGFVLTQKTASGTRAIPFARDATQKDKYVVTIGENKIDVDLTPLVKQLKDFAEHPRQSLSHSYRGRDFKISLAIKGRLLYVASGDRQDILVRR